MTNLTLITLTWELYEQGVSKVHIAQKLGKHRETIHLWIAGIKEYGFLGRGKYRHYQLPYCQTMVESFLERYHYHRPDMGKGMDMKPPLQKLKEDDCRISTEN